jgi:2-polyprenyl-3-methyl-5-hydroxy-6-metoxy-1,4-benzoquinol methylase
MGFRAYGVEPMTEASKYAIDTLKLNVINSLFKSGLFTQEEFDFIIMDQVLEHVPNPTEMLIEACHLLKPGGILLLAVPPIDWSRLIVSMSFQLPISIMNVIENSRHIRKIAEFARKYDTFCSPEGHINYFSVKAISILAKKSNAEVVGQYHAQKIRARYFPCFKLTTGSFFLRKS